MPSNRDGPGVGPSYLAEQLVDGRAKEKAKGKEETEAGVGNRKFWRRAPGCQVGCQEGEPPEGKRMLEYLEKNS